MKQSLVTVPGIGRDRLMAHDSRRHWAFYRLSCLGRLVGCGGAAYARPIDPFDKRGTLRRQIDEREPQTHHQIARLEKAAQSGQSFAFVRHHQGPDVAPQAVTLLAPASP